MIIKWNVQLSLAMFQNKINLQYSIRYLHKHSYHICQGITWIFLHVPMATKEPGKTKALI